MPQNILEPNNIFGAEDCAAANSSQAYGGAWGWADAQCNISLPLICRVTRKRRQRRLCPLQHRTVSCMLLSPGTMPPAVLGL
jgi:hypothetical protein